VIGHETAPELHSITSGRPVTPPPEPPKRRTVYRSYRIEEVPTKSSACRRLQRADGQDNPSARALTVLVDDAAQLHVGVTGSGPDALFLSGGPGRVNYVASDDLAASGIRSWFPDLRGVGRSTGGRHDLSEAVADLAKIRDAAGIQRWLVVGHSFGSDLAVRYALDHPDRVTSVIGVAGYGLHKDRS